MSAPKDDLEELARFREEWKKEVQQRNAGPSASAPPPASTQSVKPFDFDLPEDNSSGTATPHAGPSSETISGPPRLQPSGHFLNNVAIPPSVQRALAVYTRAVQHEQGGELDEALALYRQAFRMEPNIDRAYQTQEMLASITSAEDAVDQLSTTLQRAVTIKSGASDAAPVVTGTLAQLLEGFPEYLVFEPEDEEQPIHLNILPEELLIIIIRKLDHTTIERFAAVSRKARLLTLDPGIWREFVVLTYKPPQVANVESMVPVVTRFQFDYRRVYIEQPRARLDGVYIAVCHYIRPGLSENTWVNISHLITYHRYLRFFPDGKVLSLLANEETPPAQLIHTLKPTLRKKGLFIGTWKLAGDVITISNLVDASGRVSPPGRQEPFARYTFSMIMTLQSRPLGRWNKLQLTAYNSIDLQDGNVVPLGLKHERPFWFSKVKSFPAF
ncbi:hypothetical protein FB45DRAFT_924783 [Roridomyces roridus]|uniref:F-box only protein 9 n=1 Tax=Roridomyces roridus TaxID=1738132 RepID=A0AAD7BJG8_9AGAR|nr:hypothetical protein FB45DRAFT_924783 [Roridomyces roridus]